MKNCIICNKILNKKIKINGGPDIYQCKYCDMYYLDCEHLDKYQNFINDYNVNLDSIVNLRKDNYQIIINQINKLFSSSTGDIIGLEVGSATGIFLEMARNNNINMIGIEPMEKTYNIAKNKKLNIIHGFFPQCINTEKKFDFIIFNDVFEHIEDSNLVLSNCFNLLNNNGLLIINLPNSDGLLYKIANIFNKIGDGQSLKRLYQVETLSPHVYYYNKKSLLKITKNHNFKFIHSLKMKVITINGLYKRITSSKISKIRAFIYYILFVLAAPIINIISKDTCCFIFKKI